MNDTAVDKQPITTHGKAGGEEDDYSSFSRNQLIDQIKLLKSHLEQHQIKENGPTQLTNATQTDKKENKKKQKKQTNKELDFDRHPKRKIALMISYQGELHGGLAWQPDITRLSTVEGELFRALLVARLVEGAPEGSSGVECEDESERWRGSVDMNQWGYSRAGRTDAGVSGSGQVVSLWVRSQLDSVDGPFGFIPPKTISSDTSAPPRDGQSKQEPPREGGGRSGQQEELQYHTILNSILPSSVRVVAWSPVQESFDARFSCQARHYKYFFSLYESPLAPPLDIEAMQRAASRLVGEHDFRNLCRIDPSKQLNHFRRKIISAQITPVNPNRPPPASSHEDREASKPFAKALTPETNPLFVLDLVGTAFLYNMVRHIVAILFLVGIGREKAEIIDRLFHTGDPDPSINAIAHETSEPIEPIECKPEYAHATALPLLLYKCVYPDNSFQWRPTPIGSARPSSAEPFVHWTSARIRALLSLHLLTPPALSPSSVPPSSTHRVFQPLGNAAGQSSASYLPIILRPRAPHFSLVNSAWWNKVGARRLAKRHPL